MNGAKGETMMRMTAPMEVGLAVRDLARMRAFYEQALGFVCVSEIRMPADKAAAAALCAEGYTVTRLQTPFGERIKLLARDGAAPDALPKPEFILDQSGATYLTFITDAIPLVLRGAIAAGAQSLTGEMPVEVRPGVWLAFLRDPEGHLLELVSYDDISAYRPDLPEQSSPAGATSGKG